jgi:hypothetical protein
MNQWRHKDEWSQSGNGFLVQVTRHSIDHTLPSFDDGLQRWAVYAYIYPSHRLFGEFNGNDMWQPAALSLPLHSGPSLLRWHRDEDGNPTSVQVGADYNHLYDDKYTFYITVEAAASIFADAEELFRFLSDPVEVVA